MIIPISKIKDPGYAFGGNVFQGEIEADPEITFTSKIPDIAAIGDVGVVDPAFAGNLIGYAKHEPGSTTSAKISQYVAKLAMMDWVYGTRQTLGVVAQTTGIIGSELLAVKKICEADVGTITKGFNVADAVFESEAFQKAVDAIGIIPVVGWIVKAAYEISKTIAKIVEKLDQANTDASRRDLAKSLTIPMGSMDFSPEANDALAKTFFGYVKNDNADAIIKPAYGFGGGGFEGFVAKGVYEDGMPSSGPGYGMAAGYVVHGNLDENQGLGYVPGSSSMTRSIFFPTGLNSGGGCDAAALRDMSTLFPTAQNLCTGWWSQINKPGPSMFSVQPLSAKNDWENYIEHMFRLAENILKGWTCAPTSRPFEGKFKCLKDEPWLWKDMGGCGETGKGTSNKWLTIPSEFGRGAHSGFYGYLCQLYFGLTNPLDQSKGGLERLPRVANFKYKNDLGHDYYSIKALDLSKSVPVSALDDLYVNQKATLESMKCMYVSGEPEDWNRFPAFRDSSLRTLWRDSVTDVFASGAWKQVSFQDMPDGKAKSAFYDYARSKGMSESEVLNYNRPCAPGEDPKTSDCGPKKGSIMMLSAGPPLNPKLPTAPTMNGAVIQATIARSYRRPGGSTKKKSSALPLVLGAGALAFLMMRGRK